MLHHLALAFLLSIDLAAVRNEPNLEKRAYLALDNANASIDRAKTAYNAEKYAESHKLVAEVLESVELCQESLKADGRDPAKDRKQFKKVELKTSALIKRLNNFKMEVSVEDHPVIEKTISRLETINEEILEGLFSKRKK